MKVSTEMMLQMIGELYVENRLAGVTISNMQARIGALEASQQELLETVRSRLGDGWQDMVTPVVNEDAHSLESANGRLAEGG